jgi:hypothetical protein
MGGCPPAPQSGEGQEGLPPRRRQRDHTHHDSDRHPFELSWSQRKYLKSIEIDYEILIAEPTTLTFTVNKVTRGADTAVAVVAAVTKTTSLTAATCKTVDQHKQVITLSIPAWIDNDEYYLLELSMVAGAGGNTTDFLAAVANFTLRV